MTCTFCNDTKWIIYPDKRYIKNPVHKFACPVCKPEPPKAEYRYTGEGYQKEKVSHFEDWREYIKIRLVDIQAQVARMIRKDGLAKEDAPHTELASEYRKLVVAWWSK